MRLLGIAVLASALSFSAAVRAQEDQPAPPADEAPPPPAEAPGAPMSPDDARMNFGAVIDSFVAERSPKGYWPLKEKTSGKVLHLKVVSKDQKSISPDSSGPSRYLGRVILQDELSGERLKADFLVDFSGAEWAVVQMKLIPKPQPKRKPGAARKTEEAPSPPTAPQPPVPTMPPSTP